MLAHRDRHHRLHHDADAAHEVFQTSTISALLAGVYDGELTVRELLAHGDFGVGTFDQLDGEMVVLDGTCYRLRSDGSARIADPSTHTPFAAVTDFVPDATARIDERSTREQVCHLADGLVTGANLIYAVRIVGQFSGCGPGPCSARPAPIPR